MLGLDIFARAVTGVTSNFGQAVRVSLFWWLLITAFGLVNLFLSTHLVLTPDGAPNPETLPDPATSGLFSIVVIIGLLGSVIGFASIAIGWHRHLLTDEKIPDLLIWPAGFARWSYIWRFLVLALIAAPLMVTTMHLFFGELQQMSFEQLSGVRAQPLFMIPYLISASFMALFALVLPATAVGDKMGFGESFSLTIPKLPQILLLVLFIVSPTFLPALLINATLDAHVPGPPLTIGMLIGTLLTYMISWFSTMVGVSYLSELYRTLVINPA